MKNSYWVWVLVLFTVLAVVFHFSSLNIPESDSFYYLGLGNFLREQGLFNTDFTYLPYTTIKDFGVSLWYGFGIFMIPFSLLGSPIGIKLAGLILTFFALCSFYFVNIKNKLRWPWLWPLLLFFISPNILVTFLMVRPQLLSFGFGILLFHFLIKRVFWGIILSSFALVWFHMNFAWLPIIILGVVILTRLLVEKWMDWKIGALTILGILTGWLSRPEPLNAAKLFYIQIFKLIFEQQGGLPLLFGKENLPLSAGILFTNFILFLFIWLVALGFLIHARLIKKMFLESRELVFLWSAAILSTGFFLITVTVARKGYGLWAAFGILLIAGIWTFLTPKIFLYRQKYVDRKIGMVLIVCLAVLSFYSSYRNSMSMREIAFPPDKLKEVAFWLKDNSAFGDVIFNIHWSHFSPLFFWNQKNYYVGGLDPIFQYSYNESLYWKFHYLSADIVTKKTCGYIECSRDMLEDTYEVLKQDFNAKYLVLDKNQNPAVYFFLNNDSRFENKFENKNEVIFMVK